MNVSKTFAIVTSFVASALLAGCASPLPQRNAIYNGHDVIVTQCEGAQMTRKCINSATTKLCPIMRGGVVVYSGADGAALYQGPRDHAYIVSRCL